MDEKQDDEDDEEKCGRKEKKTWRGTAREGERKRSIETNGADGDEAPLLYFAVSPRLGGTRRTQQESVLPITL